ncbi:hypothetical protein KHP62_03285 [Rhodobacteraceae bacterium NNCM2]|nr:hypothetical protein [Coraliihabitans acroporae]
MAADLIALSGALYALYIILVAVGVVKLTQRRLGGDADELLMDWMGRSRA